MSKRIEKGIFQNYMQYISIPLNICGDVAFFLDVLQQVGLQCKLMRVSMMLRKCWETVRGFDREGTNSTC